MDVYEALQRLHRKKEVDSTKNSSHLTDKNNNGIITRQSRAREVSSRHNYKSPTPHVPRRCPSPSNTRTTIVSTQPTPKRAVSADRKRPSSNPPSPSSPTTPFEPHSRRVTSGKLPELLWPSTMRNLNVPFQQDSSSTHVSKKEKSSPNLIDQHRWGSRGSGKLSHSPLHGNTISDVDEIGNASFNVSKLHKLHLPKTSESPSLVIGSITSRSLPGSRLTSPSKASSSRGMASPSRTTPSTPTSSKGSSPTQQMGSATSVLSYISDLKKGKKSVNQSEDVHHLRLFYNRYSQWRFANAQADAALHAQKLFAEETLNNVWRATLELWNSVIVKRINLQKLQLELKLNVLLSEQLACLENWSILERDHFASIAIAGAINDLESSTLRLPITNGAMADIVSLKDAISSAFDMMQTMMSSLYYEIPKVEGTNYMASELADLAAEERAMLDECEAMLASTATMQEEEYGLRVQLIQLLQG